MGTAMFKSNWRIFYVLISVLCIKLLEAARENGEYCKKDRKCLSEHCCVTRCRECCLDSHCNKGQVCRKNKCTGPKPNGQGCDVNSDCRTGHCCGIAGERMCRECCKTSHCEYFSKDKEKCRDNKCVGFLDDGELCLEDSYCFSNHCCKNGKCGECCKHSHCNSAANETCLARTCVGPRDAGIKCSADSHCASNSCCGLWLWPKKRTCQECCKDEDCSLGLNCFNNVCSGPRSNTEECQIPSHCSSTFCCKQQSQSNSTKKICSECCRDNNCAKGACNQWNLCGTAIPTLCNEYVKCSSGHYCSREGLCEKKLKIKTPCRQDAECVSSSCCGIASLGRKCEQCCKAEDCKRSQTCVRRQCVGLRPKGKECIKNTQCESSKCCSINPFSPLSFKTCSQCCMDNDCPKGQSCIGRKCLNIEEIGSTCTIPSECKTMQCCGAKSGLKGFCYECCKDQNCQVGLECRKRKCVMK